MRHLIGTSIILMLLGASAASAQDAVYQQQIAQAQAAIAALTVDQQAASAQMAKAQADVASVQRKVASATTAVDQFRAQATAGFLAGPAYRAATNEINDAQASQRSAQEAIAAQLQGDAQYMQLSAEVERTLAELNELRADDPPDQNALAAASAAWLDAKNAQSKRLNETMKADASITAAGHRVATAIQARQALVNSFNHDLAASPQIASLNANVANEKTELASAAAGLASVQTRRDSDLQQIGQLQSTIAAAQQAAAAAIADANQGDNGGGGDDTPTIVEQPPQTIIITHPADSPAPGKHDHDWKDRSGATDHHDQSHHDGDHDHGDQHGGDHRDADHHDSDHANAGGKNAGRDDHPSHDSASPQPPQSAQSPQSPQSQPPAPTPAKHDNPSPPAPQNPAPEHHDQPQHHDDPAPSGAEVGATAASPAPAPAPAPNEPKQKGK